MIPKKIHYCWFGGNPLPELALKCIESWRKFLPDYEIIEWNENNFDVDCCDYVKEAYNAKKWAFVSDYARFEILYKQGGLYFDTDVELIKPFDDIVRRGSFMGKEFEARALVAPGLGLGAEPELEIYKELLDLYKTQHFVDKDGKYNGKTIVDYTTDIMIKHGLTDENEIQCIGDIFIYPSEYFCPVNYDTGKIKITENTHSIHHYSASWHDEADEYSIELKRKFIKFLPRKVAVVLATSMAKLKYEGFLEFIKWVTKKR